MREKEGRKERENEGGEREIREGGRAGSERAKRPWEVHAHVFPFSNLLLSGVPCVIESQQSVSVH